MQCNARDIFNVAGGVKRLQRHRQTNEEDEVGLEHADAVHTRTVVLDPALLPLAWATGG
jgi:hypothetical protein